MVRVSASFSLEALKVSDLYPFILSWCFCSRTLASVLMDHYCWIWATVKLVGKKWYSQGHRQSINFHLIIIQLSRVKKVWLVARYTWVLDSHLMSVPWVIQSSATPQHTHKSTQRAWWCQRHHFSSSNILNLE